MLRVSRLADYATSLMTCLGEKPEQVLSAVQVAECLQLEPPTVSKLLKLLAQSGLVDSFRGPNGGYRLARPPAEISVADVIAAIEGPISMTECGIAVGQCDRESTCGVRGNWQRINASVTAALQAVSVADMMQPMTPSSEVHIPVNQTARTARS